MQKRILKELTKTFPEHVKMYDLDYILSINETIGKKCNHINNINLYSKRYNCSISMYLRDEYPFKPPIINVENKNIINSSNISYSYWCSRILNGKDNNSIFISYIFSCISMKVLTGIKKNIPNNKMCLCCDSISCSDNWTPHFNIFILFNEYVFKTNMKKYLQPIYHVYFEKLFRNDKWNLSDDILLHIVNFL